MQAGTRLARGTRHILGVGLQAILIAAIVGTVALTLSAVYKPAGWVSGLDAVDAGGRGKITAKAGGCVVDGHIVAATGLPTGEVINFLVSDSDGTRGWVLGFTGDGTWSEPVPARNGATTYAFVSKTWGPNGSKYTTFASC